MPAGLVENEDSRVVCDLGALDEVQAHGWRVGGGHDDGGAMLRLRSLRIPQDRHIRDAFKPKRTPFRTNRNGIACSVVASDDPEIRFRQIEAWRQLRELMSRFGAVAVRVIQQRAALGIVDDAVGGIMRGGTGIEGAG